MTDPKRTFTAGDMRRLLAGVPDHAALAFGAGDLTPRELVDESPFIGPPLYRLEFTQLYSVLPMPGA